MSKFIILKFFLIGSLDQEAHVPQQMRANIRDISYSPLITSKYNQWSSKESRANDTKMGQTQLSIKYPLLVNMHYYYYYYICGTKY